MVDGEISGEHNTVGPVEIVKIFVTDTKEFFMVVRLLLIQYNPVGSV